jgi:hypothetical protein
MHEQLEMRLTRRQPIAVAREKSQQISLPFLLWAFGTPLILALRILYVAW